MKKYSHVFFDLDNTIWDFETNSRNTLEQLFNNFNIEERISVPFHTFHLAYSLHNKKLWDRYERGFIKQDELRWKRMWHTLLDFKCADHKLAKELSEEYLQILPTHIVLFDHSIELLKHCQNMHYTMGIITNGFEMVQLRKLKLSGIEQYFKYVITSEVALASKPKKEIFAYALRISNGNAASSIMIGDNQNTDIKGAKGFGMDTVFINHFEEEILVQPTYIIKSLKELLAIL